MKVILNIESLFKPRSGIGTYTQHILLGLLKEIGAKNIACFQGMKWLREPPLEEEMRSTGNRRIVEMVRYLPCARKLFSVYQNYCFNRGMKLSKDAVYHEPYSIFKPYEGPVVINIHDLSYIHYPQYHPKERVAYLHKHLFDSMARANQIITISDFVKNELIQTFGVLREKITTTHLGVSASFKCRTTEEVQPILSVYGLQFKKYLLSVATLEPRKNIHGLLDAYLKLDKKLRSEFPLVLVGGRGWQDQELLDRIQDLSDKSEVCYIGYVPENHLPFLYSGAQAIMFVSFYEGFGLPALEALASGVPLLTSEVSSIPEVVGDAAQFVQPDDIENIAQGMKILIEDKGRQAELIDKGLVRSRKFTWEKCVQETILVYQKAIT